MNNIELYNEKTGRPHQLLNLKEQINECLDNGNYVHTIHAIKRTEERKIILKDILLMKKDAHYHGNVCWERVIYEKKNRKKSTKVSL